MHTNIILLYEIMQHTGWLVAPLTQFNIIPLHVIIQGVIFGMVWFLLDRLFFKPFAKVYEKRSLKTIKAVEEAKTLNKESESLEAELKKRIERSTAEANKLRMSAIAEAKNKREEMLKQVNDEMQKQIKSMVAGINKEKTGIISKLDSEIKRFIPRIAERMMIK